MNKFWNIIIVVILLASAISFNMLGGVNAYVEKELEASPVSGYCVLIDAGMADRMVARQE